VDLGTSSNRRKVSFIQTCFQSLLSLKHVCQVVRILNAFVMLDSMYSSDKTFAERFVLVLFNYKQ